MLSKLGDRIDKGRIPFLGKRMRSATSPRLVAMLDRVLRRPLSPPRSPAGSLVALALPTLGLHTAERRHRRDPEGHAGHEDLRPHHAAFPGEGRARGRRQGRRRHEARRSPARSSARGPARRDEDRDRHDRRSTTRHDKTVARSDIPIAGKGTDDASIAALAEGPRRPRARHGRPGAGVEASSAATPPARRTTTTWSRPTRRSCSRSSSAWRSCCC
jgi:RND superfamily putative drug exporter